MITSQFRNCKVIKSNKIKEKIYLSYKNNIQMVIL